MEINRQDGERMRRFAYVSRWHLAAVLAIAMTTSASACPGALTWREDARSIDATDLGLIVTPRHEERKAAVPCVVVAKDPLASPAGILDFAGRPRAAVEWAIRQPSGGVTAARAAHRTANRQGIPLHRRPAPTATLFDKVPDRTAAVTLPSVRFPALVRFASLTGAASIIGAVCHEVAAPMTYGSRANL